MSRFTSTCDLIHSPSTEVQNNGLKSAVALAASSRHSRSWRKNLKFQSSGPDAPQGAERSVRPDNANQSSRPSMAAGRPSGSGAHPTAVNERTSSALAQSEEAEFTRTPNLALPIDHRLSGLSNITEARDFERDGDAVYGALDLGTNNCRLLLARPSRRGFRVVDAFSRIIRLGEGVSQTGRLSDQAMSRTMDALKVCAAKLQRHRTVRARMVATQACRIAENGQDFITRVRDNFGIEIEVLTPEIEARLAVAGCATLIDPDADFVLVFDIGGGSSEIVWLDMTRLNSRRDVLRGRTDVNEAIVAWESLPVGVVTLAEHFDGRIVTPESFAEMSDTVTRLLSPFEARHRFRERLAGRSVHLLGTSGTVTTIAGVHLGLDRYDRKRVDGIWLNFPEIADVTSRLLAQSYEERVLEPCIGRERADLVLAGCAILDAILRLWPAERLRVADRGLREGILMRLMMEDGVWRIGRRRRRRARRSGNGPVL
jgi:exopolyphosphatase/guanosine-5'-triphosphate,3'-diphosphate pyrophosphatase